MLRYYGTLENLDTMFRYEPDISDFEPIEIRSIDTPSLSISSERIENAVISSTPITPTQEEGVIESMDEGSVFTTRDIADAIENEARNRFIWHNGRMQERADSE